MHAAITGRRHCRGLLFASCLLIGSCASRRCGDSVPNSDPRDPALLLERWTRAEQSTVRPIESVSPRCLAQVGCPFKAIPIAPCPAPIDALSVVEAVQAASSNGPKKVFVRGFLEASGVTTTLLLCSEGTCCNNSSGELILAADADATVQAHGIRLSSSKKPSAFECLGDDSTSCCGFQSGEVIALGELHEARMVDPLLCKP